MIDRNPQKAGVLLYLKKIFPCANKAPHCGNQYLISSPFMRATDTIDCNFRIKAVFAGNVADWWTNSQGQQIFYPSKQWCAVAVILIPIVSDIVYILVFHHSSIYLAFFLIKCISLRNVKEIVSAHYQNSDALRMKPCSTMPLYYITIHELRAATIKSISQAESQKSIFLSTSNTSQLS